MITIYLDLIVPKTPDLDAGYTQNFGEKAELTWASMSIFYQSFAYKMRQIWSFLEKRDVLLR